MKDPKPRDPTGNNAHVKRLVEILDKLGYEKVIETIKGTDKTGAIGKGAHITMVEVVLTLKVKGTKWKIERGANGCNAWMPDGDYERTLKLSNPYNESHKFPDWISLLDTNHNDHEELIQAIKSLFIELRNNLPYHPLNVPIFVRQQILDQADVVIVN